MEEDEEQQITKTTFRYQLLRTLSSSLIHTVGSTFAILILVKHFHAGAHAKAILTSSIHIGLLLSVFSIPLAHVLKKKIATTISLIYLIGGIGFLLAALYSHSLLLFILGISIGLFCFTFQVPLETHIYQKNYPDSQRGKLFSITTVVQATFIVIFTQLAGWFLDNNFDFYRYLLYGFALAHFFSAFCYRKIPSAPFPQRKKVNLFQSFRWLKRDPHFRIILISWMFLGLGNLMGIALFVEYLANPKYAIAYSASQITLITGVIPVVSVMITTFFWGILFDKINFFFLRCLLNILFILSIFLYYVSDNFWLISSASAIHGMARGGGAIAWSLWVTKLATSDRVAEYMSVHTFMTGMRGILSSFLAFYLATIMPLLWVATLSVSLIVVSIILLWPEVRFSRSRRKGTPLIHKISS